MKPTKGYDTYGPAPVRLGSYVAALLDESVLEEVGVIPVPQEKRPK
jgi:hypothetical protein